MTEINGLHFRIGKAAQPYERCDLCGNPIKGVAYCSMFDPEQRFTFHYTCSAKIDHQLCTNKAEIWSCLGPQCKYYSGFPCKNRLTRDFLEGIGAKLPAKQILIS